MHRLEKFLADPSWSKRGAIAASTAANYRRSLTLFLQDNPDLEHLTAGGLRAWLSKRGWGDQAQWVAFIAIKNFLRWHYGALHPALELRLARKDPPPQRSLRLPQVQTLLSSFDTGTPKGRRDLAMCGIFLDTGLRVSEICRLALRYLDQDTQSFTVQVKGGAWSRRVYSEYTAAWLSAWLGDREKIALPGVDQVFVGIGGLTPGQAMTRHGLRVVVRAWGRAAGLGKLSPHDLRRTMGSVSTTLGAPEDIAMKAGGWKSSAVFRRYTVGVKAEDIKPYFPTRGAMEK